MGKYIYPAVYTPNELDGYCVSFPDLENVYTQGNDLPEAMDMAEDVLCLMLYDMEKKEQSIPIPSNIRDIKAKENEIVNLVSCDTKFYKKYFESKSVKVNVTLPLWLKEEGEKKHINFSQVLQEGVKKCLQMQ